ncbi:MAG: hypothetical protein Q7S32_01770 [bacterium]|nr:hypothetical protein [bacterium]
MEKNIHNFHKVHQASLDENKHSQLFFILAISAVLIGGELLWSQIRNTNFDIDSYSANVYSAFRNRDSLDIAKLGAEANAVEILEVENDFGNVDEMIESL